MSATVTVEVAPTTQPNPSNVIWYDELGRPNAPFDALVPNPDNPRNPEEFEYERSSKFRDLANSIDKVGVREPIPVYQGPDGKLHMEAGHRRRAAVEWLNERREAAYAARIARGELSPDDPRPDDLKLFVGLPITIVPQPENRFELMADMWLSESQRALWPINQVVPFYENTWTAAPEDVREDVKYMANRLGLPASRVKLLNAIVSSDVLKAAAVDPTAKVLPVKGREKTLRSVNRAAEILVAYRPNAALKITGRYQVKDYETIEILRERMIEKARQIAAEGRWPAGVAMERIAPMLKDPKLYTDEQIVEWTTGTSMIAEEVMPTTVGSLGANPSSNGSGPATTAATLKNVTAQYANKNVEALDVSELNGLIEELTTSADIIDNLLAAARSARRTKLA